MSQKYDNYIKEHVNNIQKGFDWLKQNCPEVLEDLEEEIQYQIIIHDDSKWSDEEYDAYDEYFYGTGKNDNEFNYAWLHHIHNNPHHWQYWVLREDDGNTLPLEMPYTYIVEMILDWWSFSWKQNSLEEIFNWYNTNKSKMILHENTKTTVEFILDKIKTILNKQ